MTRFLASLHGAIFALAAAACTSAPTPAPSESNVGRKPNASPPAHVVGGFSITLPTIILQPGEESFPCWVFPLEVDGPSRLVGGGKVVTSEGMHHGNITTRPKTPGEGVRPCAAENSPTFGGEAGDILDGGAVLFGSSTQIVGEEWQSFPDGMAYPIVDEYEIVARMHYLNTTPEDLTVAPSYEWYTVDETKVENVLGPFAWVLTDWEIPPLSDFTAEATCRVPGNMQLVNVMPHMHALGTNFYGEFFGGDRDGERWLDSEGYNPDEGVITQYEPAVQLGQGEGVRFGCRWNNTHDKTIYEGTGDNEMCILFGYAYPYDATYSGTATPNGACGMILPPPPGGD